MTELDDFTSPATQPRKRKRVVLWTIAGFVVLTLVLGNYGFFQIMRLERQKTELKREIERLKKEHEELVRSKELLKNDLAYIEKIAREKYRMVRPGETVFQIVTPEKPKE
jgi:cell division protein FtsB